MILSGCDSKLPTSLNASECLICIYRWIDFVECGFQFLIVQGGTKMECGASLDKEGNLQVGSPLEMASMHYQQVAANVHHRQVWKASEKE